MKTWNLPSQVFETNEFLILIFMIISGIEALRHINEAIGKGNPKTTLEALQTPEAKLQDVVEAQDYRYHVLLVREKVKKSEVKRQMIYNAQFDSLSLFINVHI